MSLLIPQAVVSKSKRNINFAMDFGIWMPPNDQTPNKNKQTNQPNLRTSINRSIDSETIFLNSPIVVTAIHTSLDHRSSSPSLLFFYIFRYMIKQTFFINKHLFTDTQKLSSSPPKSLFGHNPVLTKINRNTGEL